MRARHSMSGLLLRLIIAAFLVGTISGGGVSAGSAPSTDEPFSYPAVPDFFYRGRVVEIIRERDEDAIVRHQFVQVVRVRIGPGAKTVEAEFTDVSADRARRLSPGDLVVVAGSMEGGGTAYYVTDRYRLPVLSIAVAIFFALAILFGRRRGTAAIVGLGITALVLTRFVVPAIVQGSNPLAVSLLGALIIALTSIYLAHGLSLRTSIAVGSTLVTLVIAWGMAIVFVASGKLFGLGSEEAVYLQLAPLEQLNLQGLLLGGIILGALGVLDDITTAQSAAVDELRKANPALGARELYRRGLSVGTEHITSLVNTLFLAYAGASLPLFILFTIYNDMPLWVTLNSEFIAEEVIRTVVGSVALILAVPITTAAAAAIFSRRAKASTNAPCPDHDR
jgi:uncharacterized membrane protein